MWVSLYGIVGPRMPALTLGPSRAGSPVAPAVPRGCVDSPDARAAAVAPGSAAGEREREGAVSMYSWREDGVGAEDGRPGEENIRDQNALSSEG